MSTQFEEKNGFIEILNSTKKPYNRINGTHVYILLNANKNSPYYFGERIYFKENENANSFSYSYEVFKNQDSSISGIISNMFGEVKGFYPTSCTYRKDAGRFLLVQ